MMMISYLSVNSVIPEHLKLTRSQISAVDGDNKTTDQKRLGLLQKWKETFAHKATYRVLVAALLACGKAESALEVCKTLAQEKRGELLNIIVWLYLLFMVQSLTCWAWGV